jgi:mRNA degradation ribonuclease J1/J2
VHEEEPFDLGPFKIRYVPLAHSIPEGNAVLIETPYGNIFHTGDWKLDDEPVAGRCLDRGGTDRDRRQGRAGAGVRFDQRLQSRGIGLGSATSASGSTR